MWEVGATQIRGKRRVLGVKLSEKNESALLFVKFTILPEIHLFDGPRT